jgi:hypothetical protein
LGGQGFLLIKDLVPAYPAGKNYLLMVLLRPHERDEIYTEMVKLLNFRFIANSACRARLLRNHLGLLRLVDFKMCDWGLARTLFNEVVARDTEDACYVATEILKARPGLFTVLNCTPFRLTKREASEIAPLTEREAHEIMSEAVCLGPCVHAGNFNERELTDLIVLAARRCPRGMLRLFKHPCRLPSFDRLHITNSIARELAPVLAAELVEFVRADRSRYTVQGLDSLIHTEVPLAMLAALRAQLLPDQRGDYLLAVQLLVNSCEGGDFTGSPHLAELIDDLPYHAIRYAAAEFDGDPLIVARAITHQFNLFSRPWHSGQISVMMTKIAWGHFTSKRELFFPIMLSRPFAWYTLFHWVGAGENGMLYPLMVVRALWQFLVEHGDRLVLGPTGTCVRLDNGELHLLSPRPTSNAEGGRVNFFDVWVSAGQLPNIHHDALIRLIHQLAPKIMAGQGWRTAFANIGQQFNSAELFSRIVGHTFLRVQKVLKNFPGVILANGRLQRFTEQTMVDAANSGPCLLDSDGTVDFHELSGFMEKKLGVSLWSIFFPDNGGIWDVRGAQYAWLGFVMHPLFHKMLPNPTARGWTHADLITEYTFVDFEDQAAGAFHYYYRSSGMTIFWPTAHVTLSVGMQVYSNHLLAIKELYSGVFRAEWMQARFLADVANERKMGEYRNLRVDKEVRVNREHPLFQGLIVTPEDVPAASESTDVTMAFEVVAVPPYRQEEVRPKRGEGRIRLDLLEPEVLGLIYKHLVVTQLKNRDFNFLTIQRAIPAWWWAAPYQPAYVDVRFNMFMYFTPRAIEGVTDARGALNSEEAYDAMMADLDFRAKAKAMGANPEAALRTWESERALALVVRSKIGSGTHSLMIYFERVGADAVEMRHVIVPRHDAHLIHAIHRKALLARVA